MKAFQLLFIALTAFAAPAWTAEHGNAKICVKDFALLVGSWQGTLTYLDYTSGKPYTMPANLEIGRIGKSNAFTFANAYPNEPQANATDTVTIAKNRQFIDDEMVVRRQKAQSGAIEIVTQKNGKDGNEQRNAQFRYIYKISRNEFSRVKEVKFEGENNWIKRNEYAFKKR
ncbi:hypothetical protein C7N43_33890 [Sphingobacteriales bacterium UPWRP_1]|nr:hypothetical protein B6N25_00965 [Sphingobacteriales bacterium TSM_CSS]PSJ72500.1 hypothetical protein C7N43_33890 [Sphingobacteriales bacterium UPWRP_1]